MGGKQKVANRTKNNARPSSSGRSAALLNVSMSQYGFSGIKESTALSPFSFCSVEEFDSSIDENVQLVMKKMSKKDSTTKLKGLQELADLVKNAEANVVKAILPVWPRFFCVLSTDPDNKVREATHSVHHQIVLKAKRNIAPYLKQIMGPWFTSQYDNYPPAASAAILAFKDTFPEDKFQEVIIFCQDEILCYITENLSCQVVPNEKGNTTSLQELEAKCERVLMSCLLGYSLYLMKVPEEKIRQSVDLNSKIVSSKTFWKLSSSKIPLIRSAWFQVLSATLQKALFLLNGMEAKVLSTTLTNLEDDDPLVLPHVWECVLLATSKIPDWWTYVDIDKLFLPKLIKVLKQGGQGNAVIIYPNLLPLLSNLPQMDEEKSTKLYDKFFGAMFSGLKLKSVISSKSETMAIAAAFIECIQFLMMKNNSNIDLCKLWIKDHLISIIDWCITEGSSCYKNIFAQTSVFIRNLYRSNKSSLTQNLISFFLENIQSIFHNQLQSNLMNIEDITLIIDKQIEFLRSLKQNHRLKNECNVSFGGENKLKKIPKKANDSVKPDEPYLRLIENLAVNIFQDYINFISLNHSKNVIGKLSVLIMEFNKNKFFEKILYEMKSQNENAGFIDIYENLFKKWLTSDSSYCKGVVELIFLLLTYLTDMEKETVLNDLTLINQPNCLMWSVATALSYPYDEDAVIQKWLKGESVGQFFLSIAEKKISNECTPELDVIFKLALTENKDGGLLVSNDVLGKIIEKISYTLSQEDITMNTNLDPCCSLAAYLCCIIYSQDNRLNYEDKLVLTLFDISFKCEKENDNLSAETRYEIESAWQDVFVTLLNDLDEKESCILMEKIAVIIEKHFFLASDTGIENIEHLSNVILKCIEAIFNSTSTITSSLLEILFERTWIKNDKTVVELCKAAEYIKGNLCRPCEILVNGTLTEKNVLHYFVWYFIKFDAFCSKAIVVNEEEIYDEYTEEDMQMCEQSKNLRPLNISIFEDNLLEALYVHTILESFLMHFNNVKYYEKISYFGSCLRQKLDEVFLFLEEDQLAKIKIKFEQKCQSFHWFWCKSACAIYMKYLDVTDTHNISDELSQTVIDSELVETEHRNDISKKNITEYDIDMPSKVDELVTKVIEQMETMKIENLYEMSCEDLANISREKAEKLIRIIRLNSILIKNCTLTQTYWDLIIKLLVTWVSNCLRSRSLLEKVQYQSLLVSIGELYTSICIRIADLKEANLNMNFVKEWEDVIFECVHAELAALWIYLAEQLSAESNFPLLYLPLMQYFGPITEQMSCELIFKLDNPLKWTKFLKRSCSLLTSSQTTLQLWGYKMLKILIPGIITIDSEAVDRRIPHQKGLVFEQFKDKLTEIQNIVNSVLMEFRVGEDTCKVEPSFDSFTYIFAYLLLWDVMLSLCENAPAELHYQYADWLKNGDLFQCFLQNIFKLLSPEFIHFNGGKSTTTNDYFLKNPIEANSYNRFYNSETIEHMVCYLYNTSLVQLPAVVRQWWTDLDIKASQLVEKITTAYVSPHLITQELNDVMQYQNVFKNMKVKVLPAIREIIAVYTIDETQMELTIILPVNYPLGSPTIQCNRQISGANQKQWLLQFKKCVFHQNGKIREGLSLWNNNLDKKFDGVEECFICYAVLHFGTYQLPKLSCQTCKKKFHSACLYKWFSTSNKSSCPICRNLF